jgi:hypothetical protein
MMLAEDVSVEALHGGNIEEAGEGLNLSYATRSGRPMLTTLRERHQKALEDSHNLVNFSPVALRRECGAVTDENVSAKGARP